ncbi:unnamed protein product [Cyclocybe aegerita]|uniref:Glycopeptide n=1 Tax=Cyclocybe aegerita TaxID=1973307 RepID=A0A8S0W909_CYCAE|nr:unnamed protein product [Cyclocybe aegerita]
MPSSTAALYFSLVLSAVSVFAEKHTIRFDNRCGYGTPQLIQKGIILSRGEPFTSSGPFWAGVAYLQTGNCLLNGEGCTLVEMSLANPACPGCGSSADISLIPPLGFSVPTTFSYYGGCDGQGATCSSAKCRTAFFVPDDNHVQVQCQENDANLLITFCDGASGAASTSKVIAPVPTQPTPQPTANQIAATKTMSSAMPATATALGTNVPQCAQHGDRTQRRRSLSSLAHEHKRSRGRRAH